MNKLIAVLVAGAFASAVAAQTTAPAPAPMAPAPAAKPKIPVGGAQDQTATQAAQQAAKDVAVSKTEQRVVPPSLKDKSNQSALQNSPAQNSPTDSQAMQQKNVAASKAVSPTRERMPNVKNLTKEQRADLMKQLQAIQGP